MLLASDAAAFGSAPTKVLFLEDVLLTEIVQHLLKLVEIPKPSSDISDDLLLSQLSADSIGSCRVPESEALQARYLLGQHEERISPVRVR